MVYRLTKIKSPLTITWYLMLTVTLKLRKTMRIQTMLVTHRKINYLITKVKNFIMILYQKTISIVIKKIRKLPIWVKIHPKKKKILMKFSCYQNKLSIKMQFPIISSKKILILVSSLNFNLKKNFNSILILFKLKSMQLKQRTMK